MNRLFRRKNDDFNEQKMAAVVLAVTVAMSLSACSNMSKRDRNTAIGAGAGAIGGAVLTDGSALGTRVAQQSVVLLVTGSANNLII